MALEHGVWIMHGAARGDPRRLRSWRDLVRRVDEVGFLPLFQNGVAGFSVEEQTLGRDWWTEDPERDPWEWRVLAARSGEVAYGKFFGQKAGFISREWFPAFANFRRDGYDFDARWDDGLANLRDKKIMDCFEAGRELTGSALKQEAGFGKGGEKNFSGVITRLQMQTYLVIRDFRRQVNRRGREYGMPVSVYIRPEDLWGCDWGASAYGEEPGTSRERIIALLQRQYPETDRAQLIDMLR